MMPDPQLAGDVGGGEDRLDAGGGERRGGVDGDDVGAGVVGEVQRGVQHAGHADVVDVAAVAERQLRRPRTWRRAPPTAAASAGVAHGLPWATASMASRIFT